MGSPSLAAPSCGCALARPLLLYSPPPSRAPRFPGSHRPARACVLVHAQDATSGLRKVVEQPETITVAVNTAAHARQAHEARVRHSKVWQSATPIRRAHAPQRDPDADED